MTDRASAASVLQLARMRPGDEHRVRGWLALPTVRAWWGSQSRAEAEIALALNCASAMCRMIRSDEQPVGYAQAIDSALLEGGSVTAQGESGAWECSVFIASEPHRGQGLGVVALERLVGEVFASTLAIACTLRIPIAKETMVRAVEGAGFRWVRIERDAALGRIWLMRRERPST